MAAVIQTRDLCKDFTVYRRRQGLLGALGTLFTRERRVVHAVREANLTVSDGELVGLIGANGAGKSTTIKMLSGVLHPTSGEVTVLGRIPHRARKENARRIGVVFGHRTQLLWDLPLVETFNVLRWIYSVPEERYRRNLQELTQLLRMEDFLHTPVRNLSLGQRARGDLAAALLHEPELLFLDEPTIGLDVDARERILGLIRSLNESKGTTILLTTHDLINLEKTCRRILVIDHGRIIFDGDRDELREMFGSVRHVVAQYREPVEGSSFDDDLRVVHREGGALHLEFDPGRISPREVLSRLGREGDLIDVAISSPSIESVVRKLLA